MSLTKSVTFIYFEGFALFVLFTEMCISFVATRSPL